MRNLFLAVLLACAAPAALAQDVNTEKVSVPTPNRPVVYLRATDERRTFDISIASCAPVFIYSLELVAQGSGLDGKAYLRSGADQLAQNVKVTSGGNGRVRFYIGKMIPAGVTTFAAMLPGSPHYVSLAFQEAVLWSATRNDLVQDSFSIGATIGLPRRVSNSSEPLAVVVKPPVTLKALPSKALPKKREPAKVPAKTASKSKKKEPEKVSKKDRKKALESEKKKALERDRKKAAEKDRKKAKEKPKSGKARDKKPPEKEKKPTPKKKPRR